MEYECSVCSGNLREGGYCSACVTGIVQSSCDDTYESDAQVGRLLREVRERWPDCRVELRFEPDTDPEWAADLGDVHVSALDAATALRALLEDDHDPR